MHYVYRFKDKEDNIIYIGYTKDIQRRMGEHFGSWGHLSKECYESVNKIEYSQFISSVEAKYFEASYISTIKPKYNIEYSDKEIIHYAGVCEWILFIKEEYKNKKFIRPKIKKTHKIISTCKRSFIDVDKTQKFQVKINKKYNPSVHKYVTINQNYYLDGEEDLFTGRDLKEIQFMLLCLSLADHQIKVEQDITNNNKFMPEYIHMTIKQEVLSLFLGNHPKRNIDLLKQSSIYSGVISQYFWVIYDEEEKTFIVMVDTKIFRNTDEKRFTKVFLWDIIKTKSLSAIYVKMKIYNFLNSTSYLDGSDILLEEKHITIYISKQKFKEWCQCGKTISKYLNNAFLSINKENDNKIDWVKKDDDVRNTINITLDKLEYANHILKQK